MLERIQKRRATAVPQLDFARSKLVQIVVTDVGLCFPLTAATVASDYVQKSKGFYIEKCVFTC